MKSISVRAFHSHLFLKGIILFFAVLLRLVLLDQSFWLDEAGQILESIRPLNQQLQISADFQPPLLHILVHVLSRVSLSEWWLRLVSVFAGVGSITMVFLIGDFFVRQEQDVRRKQQMNMIFLLAGIFLSISQFHIYYSQELRQYILPTLFAGVSWLFLLRATHAEETKTKKNWIGFILATIAGLYSMYVYPFCVFAQVVYIVLHHRPQLKQFALSLLIILVAFLPWMPSFLEQLRVGQLVQTQIPGWSQVVSSPLMKSMPLVLIKLLGGLVPFDAQLIPAAYYTILLSCFAVCFVVSFRFIRRHSQFRVFYYWLILPVLFAWIVSFVVPVLSPKRALFVSPALFVVMAIGCAELITLLSKKIWFLFVGCFLAAQLFGLALYWTTPLMQRERWRETHATIYVEYNPKTTAVVFGFDRPFAPWEFYDRFVPQKMKSIGFSQYLLASPELVNEHMREALDYDHILVFDYLRDLTDPHQYIEAWLEDHGYEKVHILDTKNMGFVHEYGRKRVFTQVGIE